MFLNDAIRLCMCNKMLLQSTVYTKQLNSSCGFTLFTPSVNNGIPLVELTNVP